ncbi:MAG: hypothetical protein WCP32_19280 [Bacteroidota bacterium]
MLIRKLSWAAYRSLFYLITFLSAVTGGLFIFLIGPLFSWYVFNDLRFWKYWKYAFGLLFSFYGTVYDLVMLQEYRKGFSVPYFSPPMSSPDPAKVRVKSDWPNNDGTCNGCIQCCIRRRCVLMDKKAGRCMSYDTFLWRYCNCGRYPESKEQIDFYNCPKWEIVT